MFSQVCVKNSVHGVGGVSQHALRQTPSRGRHLSPSEDTPHGHCSGRYTSYWNALLLLPAMKLGQGNIFTDICDSVNKGVPPPEGCLLPGGACSGGCLLPGGCLGGPPGTATAAGGTHPTGMHSCFKFFSVNENSLLVVPVCFPV